MELTLATLDNIRIVAHQFVEAIGNHTLVAFYGEMGAGKTTFIKAVCNELGVIDTVNSPTFSIVNDYATADGRHIYHFDFYRLKSPQEALDFGIEEYFASGSLCLMEWPEEIGTLLPDDALKVTITVGADGNRNIQF
ncbi:MAG: tRNA (adenosine(37)-N6)-threonylcarbamoyltransferase complex ATPase subunit type 1 TsaE [Bacteroidales bacterium]|nr:tRNA (adenosine(37)-N6)-threonylcarbamoyltransferase complex ATPase subunit type 1 TsaE [Bacteroidales bacterium]